MKASRGPAPAPAPVAVSPAAGVALCRMRADADAARLAATIAGLAYALLDMRTGKLWACVTAHAVTNGALGIWVALTRQWQFW